MKQRSADLFADVAGRIPLFPARRAEGRTAEVSLEFDASRAAIFAVLADPFSYADWVVGAKEIRAADATWPEPGSTFHHTQGVEPATIRDTTSVLRREGEHLLVIEVRARPLLVARTEFLLEPRGPGRTLVTMCETPIDGVLRAIDNPALTLSVRARNHETLRRLRREVRRRA